MAFGFWYYRMPSVNNAVESAKSAAERGDADWVEVSLDTAESNLRKAKKETEDAMRKRDEGDSRDDDPDVQEGILW
ncbi:MAG: hypothetical protein F6K19_49530 [Cyanothece sp. SIO1E1]|nr:hypothetical protein [Cyanothece sp. SIO1E1]